MPIHPAALSLLRLLSVFLLAAAVILSVSLLISTRRARGSVTPSPPHPQCIQLAKLIQRFIPLLEGSLHRLERRPEPFPEETNNGTDHPSPDRQ